MNSRKGHNKAWCSCMCFWYSIAVASVASFVGFWIWRAAFPPPTGITLASTTTGKSSAPHRTPLGLLSPSNTNSGHLNLHSSDFKLSASSIDVTPGMLSNKQATFDKVPYTAAIEEKHTREEAEADSTESASHSRSLEPVKHKRVSWKGFAALPLYKSQSYSIAPDISHLITCRAEIEDALKKPKLSGKDMEWCRWALSPKGGKVRIGKSYGVLNKDDRAKYDNLNCNEVATNKNPSCDDAWGDNLLSAWVSNPISSMCGAAADGFSSEVVCYDSPSNARFCTFHNALLDFRKMKTVARPQTTPTREWGKGFLSTDCDAKGALDISLYPFYQSHINANEECDAFIDGTAIVYGHDNINNLGHSMSDFMNVWAMAWLARVKTNNSIFFNIDAIRGGHNFNDEMGQFGLHYMKSFENVILARDFENKRVCVKNLIFMPKPVILFTWDGWWTDMACSFVGPSSLFQRWNINIRHNYGLLPSATSKNVSSTPMRVLLILRRMNSWRLKTQSGRKDMKLMTSRLMSNEAKVIEYLRSLPSIELIAMDLSELSFEEQVGLMAKTSIVIGAHGAGIAATMHMPIGSSNCCGVIELFPQGTYLPIRGYGNMARRMGHYYERIEIPAEDNHPDNGMHIQLETLRSTLNKVVDSIKSRPTCVHSMVIKNPHFIH